MKQIYFSIIMLFIVFSSCKKEVAPITSLPSYESFTELDLVWRTQIENNMYSVNLESSGDNLLLFELYSSENNLSKLDKLNGKRVYTWDNSGQPNKGFWNYSILDNLVMAETETDFHLINANTGVNISTQNKNNLTTFKHLRNDNENKFYATKDLVNEGKISIYASDKNTINWEKIIDVIDSGNNFDDDFAIKLAKNNLAVPLLIVSIDYRDMNNGLSNKIIAYDLNTKQVIWQKEVSNLYYGVGKVEMEVVNNALFVFLGTIQSGKIICFDLNSGKINWQKEYLSNSLAMLSFNGDLLVYRNNFMNLLDAKTGEVKWKIESNYKDVRLSYGISIDNKFIFLESLKRVLIVDGSFGSIIFNKIAALPNSNFTGKPIIDNINELIYILDDSDHINCFKKPSIAN